jgi:hypothetical protein
MWMWEEISGISEVHAASIFRVEVCKVGVSFFSEDEDDGWRRRLTAQNRS